MKSIKNILSTLKFKLSNRKVTKIRTRIISGFLAFTVVIALLIWVFQVLLLNTFYKQIKKNELKTSSELIAANLENENLVDILTDILKSKDISINISNHKGKILYSLKKSNFEISYLNNLTQIDRFEILNYIITSKEPYMKNYEAQMMDGEIKNGIIYITAHSDSQGNYYLIILDSTITPVDSTIQTLKVQLICLTVVMILIGVSLAIFIARRLTKPIEAINQSAKQMANGNYSIQFEERGSRETFELAQTLNQTAVELSKVENLRHELLANVSHDLRTPLTMIKGFGEVMRDLPDENSPENIQIIIDESQRLSDLVNDLLDLSRLEAGAVILSKTVFSITESIQTTLDRYRKLTDFEFVFTSKSNIFVSADSLKISQVIYNLISNAVHYSNDKKIITVTQEKTENGFVRISVIDNGEGIPNDKLKDIWERYFKIDSRHREVKIGTGIGLSIVKNILDLHGGEYGVKSTVGEGSTFWFELPLSDKQAFLPDKAK